MRVARLCAWSLAASIWTLAAACPESAPRDAIARAVAEGDALVRAGRLPDALARYQAGLEDHPAEPALLSRAGVSLVLLGEHERALPMFEAARESGWSANAEGLVFWATALQQTGRVDACIARYEEALRADPDHVPALNNLAVVLIQTGRDAPRALRLLERAMAGQPGDAQVTYNLGRAQEQLGAIEEAHDLVRRSLGSTDPGDPSYAQRERHLAALASRIEKRSPPAGAPNIVLVLIDTLRPDHLGLYGYERDTSPRLDAFAKRAVVFENAHSQAPWTAPSVATLFTGLYPSAHGLDRGIDWHATPREDRPIAIQRALQPAQLTLARILRRHGYRTAAFVSNLYMVAEFGFAQGFDLYHDERLLGGEGEKVRAASTNALVLDWLEMPPTEPFFLLVHYNDPHTPYDPPPGHGEAWVAGYDGPWNPAETGHLHEAPEQRPLAPEDLAYVVGLYDGEIHHVDHHVGELLDRIDALELVRGVLTVLASDHGEEFLEHGDTIHGRTLFEEQLRVPLLVHRVGLAPRRVVETVRLIDLTPTLLELAGVPFDESEFQGRSFASLLLRGEGESRPVFGEATWSGDQRALRTANGIKLIDRPGDGQALLFDLSEDPREQDDRSQRDEATVERLRLELSRWTASNRERRVGEEAADMGRVAVDEAMRNRLRALGYLD